MQLDVGIVGNNNPQDFETRALTAEDVGTSIAAVT